MHLSTSGSHTPPYTADAKHVTYQTTEKRIQGQDAWGLRIPQQALQHV